MDENITEIIIALITGMFSILMIITNRRNDKVTDNIEKKSVLLSKREVIKSKMDMIARDREMIIHSMMVLILDSNIEVMKIMDASTNEKSEVHKRIYNDAEDLKKQFDDTSARLKDIENDMNMIQELISEDQESQTGNKKKKKS